MNRPFYVGALSFPLYGLLLGVLAPSPAEASCLEQPEAGDWSNVDPDTRGLTRELRSSLFPCI